MFGILMRLFKLEISCLKNLGISQFTINFWRMFLILWRKVIPLNKLGNSWQILWIMCVNRPRKLLFIFHFRSTTRLSVHPSSSHTSATVIRNGKLVSSMFRISWSSLTCRTEYLPFLNLHSTIWIFRLWMRLGWLCTFRGRRPRKDQILARRLPLLLFNHACWAIMLTKSVRLWGATWWGNFTDF